MNDDSWCLVELEAGNVNRKLIETVIPTVLEIDVYACVKPLSVQHAPLVTRVIAYTAAYQTGLQNPSVRGSSVHPAH